MTKRTDSLWQGLDGFERLLEHRTRLGACVLLARTTEITFARLRDLLEETDGAIGSHLGKLEEDAFIAVRKGFQGRRPTSWYRLTPEGRRRLQRHLDALSSLIGGPTPGPRTRNGDNQ